MSDGSEPEKDRRWSLRRGIEIDADISDSDGQSFAAKVTDISEDGCMIRTVCGQDLALDLLHEIKITGLEQLSAYVAWASGGKAGLTFTAPLQPAMVQSLVMKSLYARVSRRTVRGEPDNDSLGPLPPFPFKD